MVINTGQRTDIPAFYADWFVNRLKAGFVLVRNPYNPRSVTRYRLSPEVVDLIGFCTKNPAPMLPHMDLLRPYGQFWYVTITPYGKEIEPGVPDKREVLESFRRLSDTVGPDRVGWRYDPVFISGDYPAERHIRAFEYMAQTLSGYTHTAVISFVDLYEKTKRNFPECDCGAAAPAGQGFCRDCRAVWHDPPALRGRGRAGALRRGLQRVHDRGNV